MKDKEYACQLIGEINKKFRCEQVNLIDHGFPMWHPEEMIDEFDHINYRYEVERIYVRENMNLCGTGCAPGRQSFPFSDICEVIAFLELYLNR